LPAQSLSRAGSASLAQEKHVGKLMWGRQPKPQSAEALNMEPLTSTNARANPKISFLFILISLKSKEPFFSFLLSSLT
jgi:hypothetical protein